MLVRVKQGSDGLNGRIKSLRHFSVGGFQPARAGSGRIEFARKPGPIDAESVDLTSKFCVFEFVLESPFDRHLERVESRLKTSGGRIDSVHRSSPMRSHTET
jgi:hypothetical protein